MSEGSRWGGKRHKTQKQLDKKRAISGTFKKKRKGASVNVTESKFSTYRWGAEEEEADFRVRDPLVRTDFFIIPQNPQYEHYFSGLDELLYGNRDYTDSYAQNSTHTPSSSARRNVSFEVAEEPEPQEEAMEEAEDVASPSEAAKVKEVEGKGAGEVAVTKVLTPAASAVSSKTLSKLKKSAKKSTAPVKRRQHTRFEDDE